MKKISYVKDMRGSGNETAPLNSGRIHISGENMQSVYFTKKYVMLG